MILSPFYEYNIPTRARVRGRVQGGGKRGTERMTKLESVGKIKLGRPEWSLENGDQSVRPPTVLSLSPFALFPSG